MPGAKIGATAARGESHSMPRFYQPDLGTNPDDPFARSTDGKLSPYGGVSSPHTFAPTKRDKKVGRPGRSDSEYGTEETIKKNC